MSLVEKLDSLLIEKRMNKNQLSKETGIPYTTIDGFYKKGTDNVKLSTLKKIANYFGCTLDYLVGDEESNSKNTEVDDNEILTLAAHRTGHQGELSEDDLNNIKMAIKIALAKNN